MSYTAIEQAVQTLIQAMDNYHDHQVTRGDYRVLEKGADAVVLLPGSFTTEEDDGEKLGQSRVIYVWSVFVELYTQATWQGEDWINFCSARDLLIEHLRKYPNLGQSTMEIELVEIGCSGDPIFADTENALNYIGQRLEVKVKEFLVLSGGDYA